MPRGLDAATSRDAGPLERYAAAARNFGRGPEAETAFRDFDREYRPLLERIFKSRGFQDADAEDMVQSVLVLIARKAHLFEGRSAEKTWVCRIAFNLASSRYRNFNDRMTQFSQASSDDERSPQALVIARDPEPLDELIEREDAERRPTMDGLLSGVADARQRIALRLAAEGLGRDDIARNAEFVAAVGYQATPKAVKMILNRGRNSLRESLARRGIHGLGDVA